MSESKTNGAKADNTAQVIGEWAFDFSEVQSLREIAEIRQKMASGDTHVEIALLSEFMTSWPMDNDPDDPNAWWDLPPGVWQWGLEVFLDTFNKFLHFQQRSQSRKAKKGRK